MLLMIGLVLFASALSDESFLYNKVKRCIDLKPLLSSHLNVIEKRKEMCICIWVHLSGTLKFMKSAFAARHHFPPHQVGSYKWPVNKTCTPQSCCHIVPWTDLFPREDPSNKGTWWRGRPRRLYLLPPCHSRGAHINHCPPAPDPSSALDPIFHRSVGADMLLKT